MVHGVVRDQVDVAGRAEGCGAGLKVRVSKGHLRRRTTTGERAQNAIRSDLSYAVAAVFGKVHGRIWTDCHRGATWLEQCALGLGAVGSKARCVSKRRVRRRARDGVDEAVWRDPPYRS